LSISSSSQAIFFIECSDEEGSVIIYTLGHSNHAWDRFLDLLALARIRIVIDVRSYPRSRWAHFNKGPLEHGLKKADIAYQFAGDELGGRGKMKDLTYDQIAATASFQSALGSVIAIAATIRPALLCSEHEPLACHRCLLLGRHLAKRGMKVAHLLRDGTIEDHERTEQRLLLKHLRKLFPAEKELLSSAYNLQERNIRQN
jgi:uncharacterized protein (DUF488 family)